MTPRDTRAGFTIETPAKDKSTEKFFSQKEEKKKKGVPWGITGKFRGK